MPAEPREVACPNPFQIALIARHVRPLQRMVRSGAARPPRSHRPQMRRTTPPIYNRRAAHGPRRPHKRCLALRPAAPARVRSPAPLANPSPALCDAIARPRRRDNDPQDHLAAPAEIVLAEATTQASAALQQAPAGTMSAPIASLEILPATRDRQALENHLRRACRIRRPKLARIVGRPARCTTQQLDPTPTYPSLISSHYPRQSPLETLMRAISSRPAHVPTDEKAQQPYTNQVRDAVNHCPRRNSYPSDVAQLRQPQGEPPKMNACCRDRPANPTCSLACCKQRHHAPRQETASHPSPKCSISAPVSPPNLTNGGPHGHRTDVLNPQARCNQT